ncbi:helix-hairpin-helix domain-containing protein [Rubrivirga marina]|uniref:Helix-hairpin-helix DNA-binding motif class 1 domain-containing protein n=1 Tax=Rubrivirga marina TaxID=1196024 RepID=A0A271J1U9_9BACT|nr:helix-hairpin-helix domain-containing protein [Rubrivirga marina]PAP76935.1 hypothetical protein BSZ37_11080 [Rubrivirga marina]
MSRIFLLAAFALIVSACEPADESAEAPPVDSGEIVASEDTTATADILDPDGAAPFNLNTATAEQFATIPGVGERMIHEFEEYRPYTSIEQFRQEIGKYVDEDVVAGYEEYVFVPVNPNEASVATMMQLPGVTSEAEAQQLVDGRPYASEDAFLTAYESIAGEPDAASASVYVEYE